MTKFQDPSFNSPANNQKYSDNYDRVFGKTKHCTWNDDGAGEECTNEAAKGEEWCEYHLEVTDESKE